MRKATLFTLLVCACLALATGCAPGSSGGDDAAIEMIDAKASTVSGAITFYGYDDNDNGKGSFGSAAIAYPGLHAKATEDLGTYDHPSTFAASKTFAPRGTRVYIPKFRKYYVMEDICGACTSDGAAGRVKVDLYIGGNSALQGSALAACERKLTKAGFGEQIIFNPPAGYPVSTTPLFKNGVCNTQTF